MECIYEGCNRESTTLAYSRNLGKVVKCCETHAEKIAEEGYPEYIEVCPNCGCWMPVN
uniref:Uncharacterized protein n=1 Tax=viral metagenome TaxID=1070528 RepID=A0A6M3JNA3_9ZZZZ